MFVHTTCPDKTSMPDKSNDDVFDRLPKFDPSEFQPPAWANGPAFDFTRKNGESSRSGRQTGPDQSSAQHGKNSRVSKYEEDDLSDDGEEVWEDARSGLEESVEVTDEGLAFTLPEMKVSYITNFAAANGSRAKGQE